MAALTAPRTYAPAKIQLELPNQPCALAWVDDALVAATYDYVEAEGARAAHERPEGGGHLGRAARDVDRLHVGRGGVRLWGLYATARRVTRNITDVLRKWSREDATHLGTAQQEGVLPGSW